MVQKDSVNTSRPCVSLTTMQSSGSSCRSACFNSLRTRAANLRASSSSCRIVPSVLPYSLTLHVKQKDRGNSPFERKSVAGRAITLRLQTSSESVQLFEDREYPTSQVFIEGFEGFIDASFTKTT